VLEALVRLPAQLLQTVRELIAHALELAEVQKPGGGRGAGGRRGAIVTTGCSGHGNDVREALGDDRAALALEPRDLRTQRCPGRTLSIEGRYVALQEPRAGGVVEPRLDKLTTWSIERQLSLAASIDHLLLLVGHTRLLAGRKQVYQRACSR
jgi:hypothetical protein